MTLDWTVDAGDTHADGRLELIDVAAKLVELGIVLEAEPEETPAIDPMAAELFVCADDAIGAAVGVEGAR